MSTHLCLFGDATSPHTRRWATEMRARGFRVSLVTARPQPLEGVEQRVLKPVERSRQWLLRVGEAHRHVAALAPDIVHAHYVTSYGYLAARCARQPLVMTAWGSDILVTPRKSRALRWLTGWTLRRAQLITGDSADLLEEIGRYRPPGAVQMVHWGADMALFHPAEWAKKPPFRILSLRSWEPNYHIDTVIRAVALLRERLPVQPLALDLLGGGPQEAELRALVRSLGLDDLVVFHGRVGDTAMVAALHACKVSVSVPESDATSVSVLESMACGVPVVASDLPANRQWIGSQAGMLVPPSDPVALATAMQRLCLDDAEAQRIGRVNHERMRSEGGRSAQMDKIATMYERLIAGRLIEGDA